MNNSITLAMTGASGVQYGLRLLQALIQTQQQVYLLLSKPAQMVIHTETDLRPPGRQVELEAFFRDYSNAVVGQLQVLGLEQWGAPIASGSGVSRAMVVCPCTSGTLGAMANGLSRNLIDRAADVILKEQKKLILVHRETPLSVIHLQNMLRLAQLGAVIMPANPGFYHQPDSIDDLIDFIVARILDHLDITHEVSRRWGDIADD